MTQNIPNLTTSVDALSSLIAGLSLPEKYSLLEILENQIAQAEEEGWEKDSSIQAEIREARAAYFAGDYVTIDQYVANRSTITA